MSEVGLEAATGSSGDGGGDSGCGDSGGGGGGGQLEPPSTSSQSEDKDRSDGKSSSKSSSGNSKKYKKYQHKKWKTAKFKRRKEKKRQQGNNGKGDQNQNVDNQQTNNSQNRNKHGHCHKSHNNALRTKRTQGFHNATISKFFLPDKLPRKSRVIPPTKFLFGGNISDPLNLNSLQNESENACTPKSSPVPTPPKVEVLIPPNIHDPLHLLDPVDTIEYEMQLCSPMKRKPRQHRHRKRRKSCKENVESTSDETVAQPSTSAEVVNISIESASTSGVDLDTSEPLKVNEPENLVKNLRLELGSPTSSRKRRCSESSTQKAKQKRVDLDKIVSPVIPQHGGWKWTNHNNHNHKRNRTRSHSHSVSEDTVKPPEEAVETAPPTIKIVEPVTTNPEVPEPSVTATPNKKKSEQYQYGNYDRYYGYRHLNEHMDVRLKVFHRNPKFFKDKDILDIGCNVGLLTIAVGEILQPKSIVGIDIDKKLIHRARKNLSMYVRVPTHENKLDPEPGTSRETIGKRRRNSKRFTRRNSKAGSKNNPRLEPSPSSSQFFPISFPICLGTIPSIDNKPEPAEEMDDDEQNAIQFPDNLFFRTENYVPKDEAVLMNDTPQYDLILCLSVTKWMHLNYGDAGLKLAFKRMFNQLRPGGKLILEAQNWASYKKKKTVSVS